MTSVTFRPVCAFGDFATDQSVLRVFVVAEGNPVAAATLHKPSRRCGPNFTETLLPIDYQGRHFGKLRRDESF